MKKVVNWRSWGSLEFRLVLRSMLLISAINIIAVLISLCGGYKFWEIDSIVLVDCALVIISFLLVIWLFLQGRVSAGFVVIVVEMAFQSWNLPASFYFEGLKLAAKDKEFTGSLREWVMSRKLLENQRRYELAELPSIIFVKLGAPKHGKVVLTNDDDGGRSFCFGSICFKFAGAMPRATWVAKEPDDTYIFIRGR